MFFRYLAVIITPTLISLNPVRCRKITVKNSSTIWPAYAATDGQPVTNLDGSPASAGWQLNTGQTTQLNVPQTCAHELYTV